MSIRLLLLAAFVLLVACGPFGEGDSTDTPAPSGSDPLYEGSSLADAQEHLSFELRIPDPLTPPFVLESISVQRGSTAASGDSPDATAAAVSIILGHSLVDGESLTIFQTTEEVSTPSAEKMQAALLESTDEPLVEPLPPATQDDLSINAQTVRRTTVYLPDATPVVTYSWRCAGLHTDVSAFLVDDLAASDVEQLAILLVDSTCIWPDVAQSDVATNVESSPLIAEIRLLQKHESPSSYVCRPSY